MDGGLHCLVTHIKGMCTEDVDDSSVLGLINLNIRSISQIKSLLHLITVAIQVVHGQTSTKPNNKESIQVINLPRTKLWGLTILAALSFPYISNDHRSGVSCQIYVGVVFSSPMTHEDHVGIFLQKSLLIPDRGCLNF